MNVKKYAQKVWSKVLVSEKTFRLSKPNNTSCCFIAKWIEQSSITNEILVNETALHKKVMYVLV